MRIILDYIGRLYPSGRPYPLLGWVFLFLAGCGGSSGGGGTPAPVAAPAPASNPTTSAAITTPTGDSASAPAPDTPAAKRVQVNLTADRTQVGHGESVTLSWQSEEASTCTASGDWKGTVPLRGTKVVADISEPLEFHLSCTGLAGVGAMASLRVNVDAGDVVNIVFTATPERVAAAQSASLQWEATNATSCVSSGDWSGIQPVSGHFETGLLEVSQSYTLTCSNNRYEAVASITVGVRGSRIEWSPPKQNEDGAPAEDIAGYKVYWGTNPSELHNFVEVAPGERTWWEPDLPKGEYYFAISAFDSQNQEGEATEPFRKVIP